MSRHTDEKHDESLALNFSYLFVESILKKLIQTRNLKPKQFYSLFEEELLNYLNDNSLSYETTINLNDFFDIIKLKCEHVQYHLKVIQAFEALDYDCQGRAHAIYLEDHLLKCGTSKLATFLEKNLNSFTYSTLIPGPIDVFDVSQNTPLQKIVDFAYRNRCEFKNLLPKFSRKLVDIFEQRTSTLEVLLQEFYCRTFKKSVKSNILEETPVEIQKYELARTESDSNDLASVLYIWLLKFIGSISSALVAVNPGLAEEALNHIRWALSRLDFFQLHGSCTLTSSKFSSSGPFLKGVVDELRSLSQQLTRVTDAQEVHLWVEFVCGDVLKILTIILSDPLPATSPLKQKLKSSRNQIFQKESFLLEEIRTESDGVMQTVSLPDNIYRYASQFNSTCLHILSQVNDQLAINHLKIVVGQEIPQAIEVFLCKNENFRIEDLGKGIEEDLGLQLLVTFTAADFQRELKFSFDQPIFGKKILVKFISARGQLSNVGVGFYGLSLPLILVEFINKIEKEGIDDIQMESLLFLSCAAACKSHKAMKKHMNKFNFSTFSNAFLNEDTGVLICKSSEMAKVVAMEPLSKEHPSFEIEVLDGKSLEIYVGLVGKGFNHCSQLPGVEPWTLAFHGETGGIHEGNLDAKAFKSAIKPKEKLKWRIESNSVKSSIILERDGEINFEKEIPENIGLYPALALRKGATVVLLNKEPWRPKQDDNLDELSWLSIENLPLEIFLELLKKYENNNSMLTCTLHLLYNMLPFISPSTSKKVVKDLLTFVCDVVDSQNDEDIIKIIRKLLLQGTKMFFFEEEYELFDLTKEVTAKRSSMLIFEALCHHIGECEPLRLLSLPDQINDSAKDRIISSIQKIISFLTYKASGGVEDLPNPSFIHLLSSLQTLLFSWCFEHISKPENEEDICGLVSSYITLIMNSTLEEINVLNSLQDNDLRSVLKGTTMLSTCFRQLLVLIGQCCDWSSQMSKKNILEAMRVIYLPLKKLILKLCDEKWGIFCETATIHWFCDVTSSFFHLMGRLCGSSIRVIPVNSELTKIIEGKGIDNLLLSEIWRLIFRAGLQTSSKQEIQRSLSGKHGAVVESEAFGFLLSLNEEDNSLARDFIKRCQVGSNKTNLAGGTHVNSAVIALFAALVWHTQPIRESLESYIASDFKDEISEGILHAYKAAEILRLPMMKKRQDLIEEKMDREVNRIDSEELHGKLREEDEVEKKEEEEEEEHKEDMNKGEGVSNGEPERIEVCENCPIADMKSKSEFLLNFAGLQRMQESENKLLPNIGTSVDKAQNLKQSDLLAMYPSFQLVLNFVKDPQWTQAQVENLLESRKRQAIMLTQGFRHAAEFLVAFEFENTLSEVQKICMPMFFAGLLEDQTSFSKHHLDSLDGCGLMMESKVRREVYRFFKMLISTSSQLINNANGNLSNDKDNAYCNCIITATLHCLDVNWQIEDFKTIIESGLVDFLLSVISGFKPMEVESMEELSFEEELKIYSEHMQWIKEIDVIGISDFKYPRNGFASRRAELDRLLFVSRYQLKYGQEYRCDFCREGLKITENGEKEAYYRCTECNDFDICTKCAGKQIRQGNHMPYHKMVLLKHVCNGCQGAILNVRYKCNQCPKIQWCTGCAFMKKFNHEEHTSDHTLSMERLPPVSRQKSAKSCLASYNQRHAALQLSNVALRSFGCLAKKPSGKEESRKSIGDIDYQCSAEQLYEACINGSVKMLLEKNSREPPEAWREDVEGEKVWSINDILFGLLARLLPTDDTFTQLKKVWMNGRVIKSLLEILTCCEENEITDCKLMALALLKRVFQMEDSLSWEDISFYIDSLMAFGSHSLHRGQLKYCEMVVDAVRAPANHFWKKCLISRVGEKIMNFTQEPDKLVLVFYAIVLVGFPRKMPLFGYPLCYFNNEERKLKKGILVRACVNNSYEIIDVETRRKEQVAEMDVVYASDEVGIPLKLPFSLLDIMESIFQMQEDNTEHSELLCCFLSVLIKAQSTLKLDYGRQLTINVVLPKIVHNFINGNKLSRMLTSSDVENLIAQLATLKGSKPISEDESLVGADPLADIEDDDLKLQFETLSQDDNILNPYICRAIYNLYKDDRITLVDELMNTVIRGTLSDEVKESLKDVELTYKSKCSKGEEMQLEEDLGISFDLFGLRVKEEVELLRKSGMVMEEGNVKPVKLMSSKLLKEENQRKHRIEMMKKNESLLNMALGRARMDEGYKMALFKKAADTLMSINCKQFLIFFLLNTNFEDVLKINLVQDLKPLPSLSNDELWCSLVISLLTKGGDEDLMRQLLRKVLNTSTPSMLELFINVAHNFILDLTVVQYVDLKIEQGCVEVNGAESLVIQFPEIQDSKEETTSSELKAHLLISSSPTFDPLMHSLPISGSMSIEIQGNKFYHKLDGGPIDGQFLVMRKVRSKEFQFAGLEVFQHVICDQILLRRINVGNLWVRLLSLFYELPSTKRIKILSLILRISTSEYSEALDFSLLNHAWSYYRKLVISNIEPNSKVINSEDVSKPAIFLGLTELFASLASNISVGSIISAQ